MKVNQTDRKIFFLWTCGPTGRGKSVDTWRIARKIGLENCWIATDTIKWLDNYINQKCLVIEEMRYATTSLQNLLQISDKHPVNRQAKGVYGGADLIHNVILVTSAFTPQECFQYRDKYDNGNVHQHENIGQLLRRITCIRRWQEATPLEPEAHWHYDNCGPNYMYGANGQQAYNDFCAELFPENVLTQDSQFVPMITEDTE